MTLHFRVIAGVLVVSVLAISVYYRRRAGDDPASRLDSGDTRTVKGLLVTGTLGLLASFLAATLAPSLVAFGSVTLPDPIRWLGVALGLATLSGFWWLFSTLDRNVTGTPDVKTGHELVTSGPYRYVRHPLYTLSPVLWIAVGLVLGNWLVPLFAMVTFAGLALRAPREERALVEAFGTEYEEYADRTGRFLPRF